MSNQRESFVSYVNSTIGGEMVHEVIEKLEAENAELKARIKAMEEQEPVVWVDVLILSKAKENGLGALMCNLTQYDADYSPLYAAPTTAMLDKARDEENEACLECATSGHSEADIYEKIRARRTK